MSIKNESELNLNSNLQIISELTEKISFLQSYFEYFQLNEANFSKALQNSLNLLAPLLKYKEKYLTATTKNKLIFVGDDEINLDNNQMKLDTLINILKKMNLELKYQKEKMKQQIEAEELKYNKDKFEPNIDFIQKEFSNNEKIYMQYKGLDEFNDNIQYEKLVEMINKIEAFKQEIEAIYAENEELEKEKKDLESKLKMYCNLPIDINQMQQLIDIKKEEYQILLKIKH